jgi:3-oxoadipate enol-lactonase
MVREGFARTGGGRTRYLEAGTGTPVVLLHAFPLNADMWRPQLAHVPDGHRYIAPDLRGFGPAATDRPSSATTTMAEMASDVGLLLDALEIQHATIGGLSMGGYVAFALFRLAPERFSGLLLADTRSQADTAEGREARRKMVELLRQHGPSAVADEMLPRLLGDTTRRERPAIASLVRAMIDANPPDGIAGAMEAMKDRPDSTPLLARISMPTLIVVGEEDRLTPPADAESMHRQIAGSRLVTLPRAGHLSNLEAPDDFSRTLADFLPSNL